jgi:hypothetical protein
MTDPETLDDLRRADQARADFESVAPGAAAELADHTFVEICEACRVTLRLIRPAMRALMLDPSLSPEGRLELAAMLSSPLAGGHGPN